MYKININKIQELFAALTENQTLYIPADAEGDTAAWKKYEAGMSLTKKLNTNR